MAKKSGSKMAPKFCVLDTNVLMHDPLALESFADNIIVLPMTVIEELDNHKMRDDEVGRNARESVRILDRLRLKGTLSKGIKTDNGGMVRVDLNNVKPLGETPPEIDLSKPDNRILTVAYNLTIQEEEKRAAGKRYNEVWVVSKDINLRVKADALGLLVNDYTGGRVKCDSLYTGWRDLVVPAGVIDKFQQEKILSLDGDFFPNEFLHLVDANNFKKTCIVRYDAGEKRFVGLNDSYNVVYGLTSGSVEQRFAMELLLDPKIELVTLVGKSGTGKTLLALAAGMNNVLINKQYKKILVSRPIIPMGKDIGYVPGDKEEKMSSWMQPIFDNLEFILSKNRGPVSVKSRAPAKIARGKKKVAQSVAQDDDDSFGDKIGHYVGKDKMINLEALTYIRGRSIPCQFIIIDEAQNLTPHEVKTIISRAGEGTKIILTGDPDQIDHPYLDSVSNGLVHVVERLKDRATVGHVTLFKKKRSGLASIATEDL